MLLIIIGIIKIRSENELRAALMTVFSEMEVDDDPVNEN